MTGFERLREVVRELGRFSFCYDLYETLGNIADQIERERACDSDTAENIRLIVGGVIDDMERHVSGVEGADDSPAARWARELREALGGEGHDPAADVSMSAYDLLPQEERDAIAWVRDHGGLDHVREEWRSRVPYDRYERRRQRLLGHIAECETALGRRNVRIEELGHRVSDLTNENAELLKRSMPEGYEWPRYESGELLRYKDRYIQDGAESEVWHIDFDSYGDATILNNDGSKCSLDKGERVKRPAVLASDGEPLEVGQTVFGTRDLEPVEVVGLRSKEYDGVHTVKCKDRTGFVFYAPDDLTHQIIVLDADGVPIREGETVWDVDGSGPFKVKRVEGCSVTMTDGHYYSRRFPTYCPSKLTHERPVVDTWQRIEEDACKGVCDYFHEDKCDECEHVEGGCCKNMARDIVRRCRALAEKESRNE